MLGYVKQQIPQRTTDEESPAETKPDPEEGPTHGVREDQHDDAARGGAQSHSDANLLRTARDKESNNTEKTYTRQQNSS